MKERRRERMREGEEHMYKSKLNQHTLCCLMRN
jgi:hypothetical protein